MAKPLITMDERMKGSRQYPIKHSAWKKELNSFILSFCYKKLIHFSSQQLGIQSDNK
jgi:hypothetical protein